MMSIPDHWIQCKLGDVIRVKNGYAFKSNDYADDGTPLIRISDINDNKVSTDSSVMIPKDKINPDFYINPGDLLIAMSGATTGKTGVYSGKEPVLQNQRVGNFKIIDEAAIDGKYRNYYIASLRREIEEAAYGGAQPNISSKGIESFDFPLAPPDEQKLIVSEIEKQFSRLDEAVAALKRIKANLKRYKASVLKAAVEGKLTEEWRKEHPDVEPASELLKRILVERRRKWEEAELGKMRAKGKEPKDDKWQKKYGALPQPSSEEIEQLHKLPAQWVYIKLGEVIDEPKYGTSKKCGYKINGMGVLRIPNVVNGIVDDADLKFAKFDEKEIQTYGLREGDMLTIRSNGSVSLVGKCALITKADEQYIYAGYLIKLSPFKGGVLSKYLMICFASLLLRKQIESKAKSTSGVNNINSGELQSLIIPICRKEEQEEIVRIVDEKLSSVEHFILDVDLNLKRAERLRQSILKKAFSGKLISEGVGTC